MAECQVTVSMFLLGNCIRLSVCFTRVSDGSPVDADEVTLQIVNIRTGVLETFTLSGADITHIGVGEYTMDYTPSDWGQHRYRYAATGSMEAAAESRFMVLASQLSAWLTP